MLDAGDQAPDFSLKQLDGTPARFESGAASNQRLIVFFETDCPTCLLMFPYLNRLSRELGEATILGISQDGERETRDLIEGIPIEFPVVLDPDLAVTRLYDPIAVPTIFLIDAEGRLVQTLSGFDKRVLNAIATAMAGKPVTIADAFDGRLRQIWLRSGILSSCKAQQRNLMPDVARAPHASNLMMAS
jgi:peroxiredoxin